MKYTKKKRKIRHDKSIIAIDPGPFESGVICMEDNKVTFIDSEMDNVHLRSWLMDNTSDVVACEGIASYGMAVGKTTFETCYMIGRIQQIVEDNEQPFMLVYRKDVKIYLCNSMQAKQKNIRQALIDMFPGTGGGSTPQIGIKANKGPLYGVGTHAWSALAIAVFARNHS